MNRIIIKRIRGPAVNRIAIKQINIIQYNEEPNNYITVVLSSNIRGRSRRVAKFISESHSFHIKSKAIKMLSCTNFATLLDPPLHIMYR